MAKQLNFKEYTLRAKSMSVESLNFSIKDCIEAAQCSDSLDAAGMHRGVDHKDSGFYYDEASCYRQELIRREKKFK